MNGPLLLELGTLKNGLLHTTYSMKCSCSWHWDVLRPSMRFAPWGFSACLSCLSSLLGAFASAPAIKTRRPNDCPPNERTRKHVGEVEYCNTVILYCNAIQSLS